MSIWSCARRTPWRETSPQHGKSGLFIGDVEFNGLYRRVELRTRRLAGQPVGPVVSKGKHSVARLETVHPGPDSQNTPRRRISHRTPPVGARSLYHHVLLAAGANLTSMHTNQHLTRARLGYLEGLKLYPAPPTSTSLLPVSLTGILFRRFRGRIR